MPNSKTLLQTILAAFCAILCTHLCVGGGGMIIGARTAAWAKSGYTAKDYVQNGLVAMWDGIENAGWGVHDPNATTWRDLISSNDLSVVSGNNYNWLADRVNLKSTCFSRDVGPGFFDLSNPITVEHVCVWHNPAQYGFAYALTLNSSANRYLGITTFANYINMIYAANTGTTGRNATTIRYNNVENLILSFSQIFADSCLLYDGGVYFGNYPKGTAIPTSITSVRFSIGGMHTGSDKANDIDVCCTRIYSRALAAAEIAANYAIDKARFNVTV